MSCGTGQHAMRLAIVAEARSWVGTPYHLGAMLKGAGCDCGTLLLGVAQACGFALDQKLERFTQDWFCHTSEEKYEKRLLRNATLVIKAISYPTLKAQPGDLVLTHHSHMTNARFNHGGIVVAWPKIIHAVNPKVEETDATQHWMWNFREVAVFSLIDETVPYVPQPETAI
jgi:cell wall-associated NlpC family hydrolase